MGVAGGGFTVIAGNGGAAASGTGGTGGTLLLRAGDGGSGNGDGGNIVLDPGAANGTGDSGLVQVGATSADGTGQLLALDTKNTAGDPTGTNGAMYYNSNLGKFRCFENSAWDNCMGFSSDAQRKMAFTKADFQDVSNVASNAPWIGSAIGTGTNPAPGEGIVTAEHPGIATPTTAASTANTGYQWNTTATAMTLGGGQAYEAVFKTTNPNSTITRAGFCDTTGTTDCQDGAYFELNGTTLAISGKTANIGTRSTTASSFTMSGNTWYRVKIVINSGATLVSFFVYNESGTQLFTDTLNANIPSGAGRSTGSTFRTYTTAAAASVIILNLDYIAMWEETPLVR